MSIRGSTVMYASKFSAVRLITSEFTLTVAGEVRAKVEVGIKREPGGMAESWKLEG
jgi:hypothetical protein